MKDIQVIKAMLEELDLNRDGFVTTAEVLSIMGEVDADDEEFFESLGLSLTDENDKVKIEKVAGRYSKTQKIWNNIECIFTEFLQILESFENADKKLDKELLNKLFNFFDENGDGKLSRVEAKVGCERFDMWKGGIDEIFEELKDDEGKVSIKGEM